MNDFVPRLTVRVPHRAHKVCVLCNANFLNPLPVCNNTVDNVSPPVGCPPCRKCEKCSRCRVIKKTKQFHKEGGGDQLYRTCARCGEENLTRVRQKQIQAELVSMRLQCSTSPSLSKH